MTRLLMILMLALPLAACGKKGDPIPPGPEAVAPAEGTGADDPADVPQQTPSTEGTAPDTEVPAKTGS